MKLTITITKKLTQEESDYIATLSEKELKEWVDETNADILEAIGLSEEDVNTSIGIK